MIVDLVAVDWDLKIRAGFHPAFIGIRAHPRVSKYRKTDISTREVSVSGDGETETNVS